MSENSPEISSKEDLDETSPGAASNFHSLKSENFSLSSVNLQWDYVRPQSVDPSREIVFKLLKQETRDEWKSIAWTRKKTCIVENLEQNVCYSLKLLALVEDENEFRMVDESEIFKVKICGFENFLDRRKLDSFEKSFLVISEKLKSFPKMQSN